MLCWTAFNFMSESSIHVDASEAAYGEQPQASAGPSLEPLDASRSGFPVNNVPPYPQQQPYRGRGGRGPGDRCVPPSIAYLGTGASPPPFPLPTGNQLQLVQVHARLECVQEPCAPSLAFVLGQ
jgi:hypothetical protein